jgi:hypothetical protein
VFHIVCRTSHEYVVAVIDHTTWIKVSQNFASGHAFVGAFVVRTRRCGGVGVVIAEFIFTAILVWFVPFHIVVVVICAVQLDVIFTIDEKTKMAIEMWDES